MNRRNKIGLMIATVMITAIVSFGAGAVNGPVANLTERFTNNPSWKIEGTGVVTLVEQSLQWSFGSQSWPMTRIGAMAADSTSSSGRFVGNYSNSAISKVSFDVNRPGVLGGASFKFRSANGHLWLIPVALPATAGVWEHRDIPMTYSADWYSDEASGQAAFDVDRAQVTSIAVEAQTQGTSSQSLKIASFKVVGPWEKGPYTADGTMPQYWLMENGMPVQDGMATLDKDGDGFNNYSEYLAGTDPNDPGSQFRIYLEKDENGSPVLTWKHSDYRAYKVFKSSDLTLAGSFLEEKGAIQQVGQQNRMAIESQSSGPNFYRVQVDVAP